MFIKRGKNFDMLALPLFVVFTETQIKKKKNNQ